MNEKIEALVRMWHEAYAEGEDVWGTEDLIRKVATEAWEQATLAEREACLKDCFDPTTRCSDEDHCGCREDIARAIRARGQAQGQRGTSERPEEGKEQGDEHTR